MEMNKTTRITRDVKQYWKQSPYWAKIVWVLSTLFSSSSIASLGDTVFAWKGFILDGINFYRIIVSPIKSISIFLYKVEITTYQADLIVLFGLFFASYLRFTLFKQLEFIDSSRKTKGLYLRAALGFLIIWCLTTGFVAAGILKDLNIGLEILVVFVYIFVLLYPLQVIGYLKFNISNNSLAGRILKIKKLKDYSKNKAKLFIVYYGPVVVAIFTTFILAAINAGLTR